jgi:hypothetical protein
VADFGDPEVLCRKLCKIYTISDQSPRVKRRQLEYEGCAMMRRLNGEHAAISFGKFPCNREAVAETR